jgi:hypothetical protein
VFAAAAIAATGLSVYYLWSGRKGGESQARTSNRHRIVLLPTLGGMIAEGRW